MKYPGKLFLILTLSMLSGSPLFAQQPAAADIPSAAEAAEERTAEEFLQNADRWATVPRNYTTSARSISTG